MLRVFATSVRFMLFVAATVPLSLHAQETQAAAPETIEKKTHGIRKLDGYFPLYWDNRAGILWLEIPRLDTDFLFTTGLATGLGSNDIGLDRGQAGDAGI